MRKLTASAVQLALTTLLGVLSVQCAPDLRADGHYVPGVECMQAAGVPPAGAYYLGYLVNSHINNFRVPGSSDKLPGHNRSTVAALANRVVWVSPYKLLGADYGMETIVPVMRTSLTLNAAGISDTRSGMGDVYLGPLVLGWHGSRRDAVAAAGVWLNSGSSGQPASPGKGFKSTMLSGGLTWYFDEAKAVSGSALMRFERNGRNDTGMRPGNQVTLEWGLGKSFGTWQAGLVGYSQWQVSDDSDDSGAGASTHRASRHAKGAELVYPVPSAGPTLKGAFYKELDAKAGAAAQPKGSLLRFHSTLVKVF